jgi:beta-glucosidase
MHAPYLDPDLPLDARVADLLPRLTLEEKVRLLAGASSFGLHGVERLGVPSLRMTDGPTGVRSIRGEPATVFPVGVAVAATWNPETARAVAGAIAREAQALGDHVVLAPTINILRTPAWGRAFETYSEDPYLAGTMGAAYVQGLQAEGVGASLKHYAANNQELERFTVDARLDEQTLREIYLAAFERVVREADPWTVMASYNRINGIYASENRRLLTDILKVEWGYPGMVVSDWGAVHATAATVNAGLDLEMPGPARWLGEKLLAAVQAGEVPETQIDDNAGRVLRLILRAGLLDGRPPPPGELRTPRHRAIARDAACEAMTLLKNDGGLLPLPSETRRIALIGPNAHKVRLQGGGSSQVATDSARTVLEALQARLPHAEIRLARGVDNDIFPPIADAALFSPTQDRGAPGLHGEYYETADVSGPPARTRDERGFVRIVSGNIAGARRSPFRAFRWSGWFWPPESGVYAFGLRANGQGRLDLDGAVLISPDTPARPDRYDVMGGLVPRRRAEVRLEAGRGYPVALEYVLGPGADDYVGLGVSRPPPSLEEAIAAARDADAVILVLGSGAETEGEGYDREDLALPGDQDALARAVLAANPRTVVVLNTGAPFDLPWAADAPAILQMWLPGETGPDALAAVLFGDASPGGRLPMSWPAAFGELAAHRVSADPKICDYAEGLAVGYRGYDLAGLTPLFPFGHGLTYGDIAYEAVVAPDTATIGAPLQVQVTLRNTGSYAVTEVIQLYVARPNVAHLPWPRPPKELKAYAKVRLALGETRTVTLDLEPDAFAAWDVGAAAWTIDAGPYALLIGCSAGDVRLRASVTLA